MILLRVSLFFIVLLLLPDWYIYKAYIRHQSNKLWKQLFGIPSASLLLVLLIFILFKDSIQQHHFGTYLIITLCIAVPKAVFALFSLLTRGISNLLRIRLPHGWIALLPALAAFGYILFGAVRGKENFKVHQVTYVSPDLPDAFDGYRILQLSDIHSGSWKGNGHALQRAIDLCNAQHPDLAVFTGDLVNSRADELTEFVPVLSQLRAKDGVFSVLGNHDYGTYTRWESELDRIANVDSLIVRENRMGWQMLMNSHRILHRGNDSIALAGVENSGAPPFPDYANLTQALQGTEGMFKILLSHDPTHWRREILPESDVQLTLSGHTHDMQIRLFGFSFSRFVYPEHCGMYLEDGRGLYVNVGLGYVLFPMRLGAWPEITLITLRKSSIQSIKTNKQ